MNELTTLEELLRKRVIHKHKDGQESPIIPDFRIAVQELQKKFIRVLIHPLNYNGDTMDLIIRGNEIELLKKGGTE